MFGVLYVLHIVFPLFQTINFIFISFPRLMFQIVDQGGLISDPVYVTLNIIPKDDHQTMIALTPVGGVSCLHPYDFLK